MLDTVIRIINDSIVADVRSCVAKGCLDAVFLVIVNPVICNLGGGLEEIDSVVGACVDFTSRNDQRAAAVGFDAVGAVVFDEALV